jgi:hypothetical protein
MQIVKGLSLRALVASIGVAAVLAAGCGTPARRASAGGPHPVSAAPSTGSPAVSPTPHLPGGTPPPGYADPLDRYAYREAFGRCTALGVAAVADAFGASAPDPVSAATAYAANAYPRITRLREAATQGCLDGFSHRT